LCSCATNFVADYSPQAISNPIYKNRYFSDPSTDYVYKANLSVYGNDLSGIFIAKKINHTIHRVVFTTEFGNKLLDFEISESHFKVNYLIEDLDRKILINILREDFRLLLKEDYTVTAEYGSATENVFKSEGKNLDNYLFVNKVNNKLMRLINASKRKEKINIAFTSENDIFADRIIIQHENIKLRIELNFFEKQPKQTP
jgi:hypothetical protein